MDKKLDCCVVRDLLPAYIENLTEEETTAQVRKHLEDCGACQSLERDMCSQVPVEKAPKGALNFLKRVNRTRLIAAHPVVHLVAVRRRVPLPQYRVRASGGGGGLYCQAGGQQCKRQRNAECHSFGLAGIPRKAVYLL